MTPTRTRTIQPAQTAQFSTVVDTPTRLAELTGISHSTIYRHWNDPLDIAFEATAVDTAIPLSTKRQPETRSHRIPRISSRPARVSLRQASRNADRQSRAPLRDRLNTLDHRRRQVRPHTKPRRAPIGRLRPRARAHRRATQLSAFHGPRRDQGRTHRPRRRHPSLPTRPTTFMSQGRARYRFDVVGVRTVALSRHRDIMRS